MRCMVETQYAAAGCVSTLYFILYTLYFILYTSYHHALHGGEVGGECTSIDFFITQKDDKDKQFV